MDIKTKLEDLLETLEAEIYPKWIIDDVRECITIASKPQTLVCSKDYERLYDLLYAGYEILGTCIDPDDERVGAIFSDVEIVDGKDHFLSECTRLNLEWVSVEQPKEQGAEPIAWIPEDELPESLPADAYNELFSHSKVDFIRLFPIYGPQTHSPREKALDVAGIDDGMINKITLAIMSVKTMDARTGISHWSGYEIDQLKANLKLVHRDFPYPYPAKAPK